VLERKRKTKKPADANNGGAQNKGGDASFGLYETLGNNNNNTNNNNNNNNNPYTQQIGTSLSEKNLFAETDEMMGNQGKKAGATNYSAAFLLSDGYADDVAVATTPSTNEK